ncbi:MAG: FHA domain-containing protein [Anaerolineales bacterium]|jgi:hypothetical protein
MMKDRKVTRELHETTHVADSPGWVPIHIDQGPLSCPDCGQILAEGWERCVACGRAAPSSNNDVETRTGASLIVVEGGMAGKVFPLQYEVHVIGRGEEADLIILDPEISRMHARFKRHEEHYILEDLRSANGTWINDAKVEGRQLLLPGDRLRLGKTELIIRYSTALI